MAPPPQWGKLTELNDATTAETALALSRAGVPVFPCYWPRDVQVCACDRPDCKQVAKHPLVKWSVEACADPGRVAEWWGRWPYANIGMPTGSKSGLIAIDLDMREIPHRNGLAEVVSGQREIEAWLERRQEQLPDTASQQTGSGGLQRILLNPDLGVRTVANWLPGVDLRGDGGYVIVAPSLHRTGNRYLWLNDLAPAAVPPKLAAALMMAKGHRKSDDGGEDGVEHAVEGYAQAKKDGPRMGQRDDFFNAYAFELRKSGVQLDQATSILHDLWTRTEKRDEDEFPWSVVQDKLERVWADPSIVPEPRAVVEAPQLAWVHGQGQGQTPATEDPPVDPAHPTELGSDLGNTNRFAKLYADRIRFVPTKGWLIWDGQIWAPDRTDLVMDLTKGVIADLHSLAANQDLPEDQRKLWSRHRLNTEGIGRRKAIVEGARSDQRLVVMPEQTDPDRHLLCTPGGVLNLQTLALAPHDPALLQTVITAASLDWAAEGCSELVNQFEATFLPDPEIRAYLYRALGQALLGDNGNRLRLFVIIFGSTTSGKSMLAEAVRRTLGGYAISGSPSILRGSLDDKPRPDVIDVMDSRMLFLEEASEAWELHSDAIKRITGGAQIPVRAMRSDVIIKRAAEFTPVVVTNEPPHIKGADEAIRRRVLVVPMDHTLPAWAVDPSIKQRFVVDPGVHAALLAKLVRGCWEAQHDGIGEIPAGALERAADLFAGLDNVEDFMDWLKESGTAIVDGTRPASHCYGSSELYEVYAQWTKRNRQRQVLNPSQFRQRMESLGYQRSGKNSKGSIRWLGLVKPLGYLSGGPGDGL